MKTSSSSSRTWVTRWRWPGASARPDLGEIEPVRREPRRCGRVARARRVPLGEGRLDRRAGLVQRPRPAARRSSGGSGAEARASSCASASAGRASSRRRARRERGEVASPRRSGPRLVDEAPRARPGREARRSTGPLARSTAVIAQQVRGVPGRTSARRRRASSKQSTVAAIATFSDSAPPSIGIVSAASVEPASDVARGPWPRCRARAPPGPRDRRSGVVLAAVGDAPPSRSEPAAAEDARAPRRARRRATTGT